MPWDCPNCAAIGNDDATMRCTCGYELEINEAINYDKIGGALYLVLFGLVLTPLINILPMLEKVEKGFPDISVEGYLLAFSFVFYVIFPIFMIALLLKRKKVLRPIIICYYLLNFLVSLSIYYGVKAMLSSLGTQEALLHAKQGVVAAIIGCGIWVTYFLYSERVKKTLIK